MPEKISKIVTLAVVVVFVAILIGLLFTAKKISVAAGPHTVKIAAPVAQPVISGQKVFTVQVASFSDKVKSDIVAEMVQKTGYSVVVVPGTMPDKKIWYRVLVGDFDTIEKAKACLVEMQKLYKGSFIKQK